MIGAVVLRPAPGNARTVAALAATGIDAIAIPLFAVRPVAWVPPDPGGFDAILFTSANAPRHGGVDLSAFIDLPAIAVGATTAAAARAAGFAVALTGNGDVADVLAGSPFRRPLHLAGRDHRAAVPDTIVVYASECTATPTDFAERAKGRVALLHSARAASRFAMLIGRDRARIGVAALSVAVGDCAGAGWAWIDIAPQPTDAALVAAVARRLTGAPAPGISGE